VGPCAIDLRASSPFVGVLDAKTLDKNGLSFKVLVEINSEIFCFFFFFKFKFPKTRNYSKFNNFFSIFKKIAKEEM
jgi:hypothetical protein